jgi:hypothetical protein
MLGSQVASDLEFDTLSSVVPLQTAWGKSTFQSGLTNILSDISTIKRRQLPIMALRMEPTVCKNIVNHLSTLHDKTASIDDVLGNTDPRITESVSQILWNPTNVGAFLNKSPVVMNALIVWRTIILPGFAVLAPLIAVIIPFFLLRFLHPDVQFTTDEYMNRVRQVLLQQITVPSFLKSRHADDRIGFVIESLFIALTLGMFVSGIWGQITNALHTRTIWFDLDMRGQQLQHMYNVAKNALDELKTMGPKTQRACVTLIDNGEAVLRACKEFDELDGVATFGSVWNDSTGVKVLRDWLASLDCYTAIASLDGICFPRTTTNIGITLKGVHHPLVLDGCVSNNYITTGHSILTGPNRGGKSTYCKAVGLAIVMAQTWGFAWATSMTWSPFLYVMTALEPTGLLGSMSTFESEIEFAKVVLAIKELPMFVMMDEIFHSTNAGDGLAASRVFMKQLYEKTGVISIISTHYKELAESFSMATPLYMDATLADDGNLIYTYTVRPGVSDKSSVMEILKERGLLPGVLRLDV